MSTKNLKILSIALIMLLSSAAILPPTNAQQESPQRYEPVSTAYAHLKAAPATGNFVIQADPQGTYCRDASPEESQALAARDEFATLHVITPVRAQEVGASAAGLKIILRSTSQLENFPQAKNAFLRAAQTWEAIIQTPITIILDVDYGPTRFGIPYPNPNILGSTGTQDIGATAIYPDVRSKLIATASNAEEAALYNALPTGAVPTDLGSTAAIQAPAALFRAVGIIAPVANPATETADLGAPPSIGFNSSFQFDFNPDDGIDAGKYDFDSTVVHEIGHALGFSSEVGTKELNPAASVAPSFLDLLRFRPGMTRAAFSTAPRIQSSGGTQVFFAGGPELPLSTGRGDGTGGDGQQASHWKDDELLGGRFIGIMDPNLNPGKRETLTDNDLLAFEFMGYQVGATNGGDDTIPLASGAAQQGSIRAPRAGEEDAVIDDGQYTIQVPTGANQLIIELDGNQDIDLYVRAAQRVTINSSGLVADYVSNSPAGHESVVITPSSSPALRAGTYYIAILNFGPGSASFTVKATVSGGGGGGGGNSSPVINTLQADLKGDDLLLTGLATDPDGDMAQAQSTLFDGSGQVVGQTSPFNVNFGNSTSINFTLTISNLNTLPAAVKASVILIDRRGNRSAPVVADFGRADAGGPTLTSASYNGSKLVIKGADFSAQVLVEINGQVIGIFPSATDRKAKVKGDPNRLHLRPGPNRLRVSAGSTRSNLFVLEF
jgi:hypothetical protein